MQRSLSALAAVVLFAVPVFAQAADSQQRVLVILNKTKSEMLELYTSPADSKIWGADQLGNMRIGVGGKVTVNLHNATDDCVFDLMMIFGDGEKVIRRENVCGAGAGTLTITEHKDDPLPAI